MSKNKPAELALLIMSAGRLLHKRLHEHGVVSMLHFKILCFIDEHTRVAMKDLAVFLGVTAPSATVLVDRMVRSGELARVPGASDRRSVDVKLTALGKKSLLRDRKALVGRMNSFVSRLSRREVDGLTAILKNLLKE
jgi:DNA-binding MarR family transcriptional regulator